MRLACGYPTDARNAAIRAAAARGEQLSDLAVRYGISRQRVDQLVHGQEHAARTKSSALTRPTICEDCQKSSKRIAAHHEDYADPLNVRWLCRRCHKKADMKKRAPIIEARRIERLRRDAQVRTERWAARKHRQKLRRQERWHQVYRVLKQFIGQNGRAPTYRELAERVFCQPIGQNAAVPKLAGWLWGGTRPRYWRRVQALYRLAGVRPRGVGGAGHVHPYRQRRAA